MAFKTLEYTINHIKINRKVKHLAQLHWKRCEIFLQGGKSVCYIGKVNILLNKIHPFDNGLKSNSKAQRIWALVFWLLRSSFIGPVFISSSAVWQRREETYHGQSVSQITALLFLDQSARSSKLLRSIWLLVWSFTLLMIHWISWPLSLLFCDVIGHWLISDLHQMEVIPQRRGFSTGK